MLNRTFLLIPLVLFTGCVTTGKQDVSKQDICASYFYKTNVELDRLEPHLTACEISGDRNSPGCMEIIKTVPLLTQRLFPAIRMCAENRLSPGTNAQKIAYAERLDVFANRVGRLAK